jgi:hypothetical protein
MHGSGIVDIERRGSGTGLWFLFIQGVLHLSPDSDSLWIRSGGYMVFDMTLLSSMFSSVLR